MLKFYLVKKWIQNIKDPNHETANLSYVATLMKLIEYLKEESKTKTFISQSLSNQYNYTYNDNKIIVIIKVIVAILTALIMIKIIILMIIMIVIITTKKVFSNNISSSSENKNGNVVATCKTNDSNITFRSNKSKKI